MFDAPHAGLKETLHSSSGAPPKPKAKATAPVLESELIDFRDWGLGDVEMWMGKKNLIIWV